MIELPTRPSPNRFGHELLDQGINLRGSSTLRVERPGSRYRISFSWPAEALPPEVAGSFVGPLQRAKRIGLQMPLPRLRHQGSPGTPVVDGAGQSGTTIAVRNLTPGYVARSGYWMTIVEADGTAYLHNVFQSVSANVSGEATFEIEPPLRAPFADGDMVELSRPYVQGFIVGETLSLAVEQVQFMPLTLVIEEYQ